MTDLGLVPAPRHAEVGGPGPSAGAAQRREPAIRVDAALPAEGFELTVGTDGVEIAHRDDNGLRYARAALEQLHARHPDRLPGLRIRDWPDFPARGYMLDISRDRVPTMETLDRLVAVLERLRINQLQLYTEHTFAYAEHETVWRDASPLTADEIQQLDRRCTSSGIELVPNQNSFGHMERWLRHDEYAHLGELGPEHRGSRAPSALAPDGASLAFVRALYRELLPNFTSGMVNINCDETFDLGRGRSREACETRGTGRVYLDFLSQLIRGLQAQGRTVQFWGDIVANHPELVPELPREGLITLVWGYEAPLDPAELPADVLRTLADYGVPPETLRGFAARVRPFAENSVPFYVCPGTSSWNSLVGRWSNARGNLLDAAECGLRSGACGYLITDWGDNGHLQPGVVSLPPLLYGAAVSWCLETNRDLDVECALSEVLLRDPTGELATALIELGELYAATGLRALNASPLFLALQAPLHAPLRAWGETSSARLERVHGALDEVHGNLERARPDTDDGDRMCRELAQAARLTRHGAWRLGLSALGEGPTPGELALDLEACVVEQRAVWLARSRPGGLEDSLAKLVKGSSADGS
jgi:hexosaminidase